MVVRPFFFFGVSCQFSGWREGVAWLASSLLLFWPLVSALVSGLAHAQATRWVGLADTPFLHYTTQNGLPNNAITTLVQDNDGFLWIGTQDGLVRWDGYRFRTYQPLDNDPASLPNNYIQTLHMDLQGRLWIGTLGGGLARYAREQDNFVRYGVAQGQAQPPRPGLTHISVTALADDGQDGLWIGTAGGLNHLDTRTGQMHASGAAHAITSLIADHAGKRLWIAHHNRLVQRSLLPANRHAEQEAAVFDSDIYCVLQASDRQLWVGTRRNGAFRVNPGTGERQAVREGLAASLAEEWIAVFMEPNPGEMWIGTVNHGVVVLDAHGSRRIQNDPMVPGSLSHNTVETLFRDRSGLIWAGTNYGLSRLYPQTGILTLWGVNQRQNGLAGKDVRSILAAKDGQVWLGFAAEGVQIIDPAKPDIGSQYLRPEPARPLHALPASAIMVSRQAANGDVYLGTGRGVYRVTATTDQIEQLNLAPRDNVERTTSLLLDNDSLWIGSNRDGLWQHHLGGSTERPAGMKQLSDQRIISLEAGAEAGSLWVGTQNGVNRLRPQNQTRQTWDVFLPRPNQANQANQASQANLFGSLSSGMVLSTLSDRQGRLWIGTSGTGIDILLGYDAKGQPRFRHLGVEHGLPNGIINKLLQDQNGNVWASTDNGLAFIDQASYAIRALGRADGVAISNYWSNSGAVTQQGELLFGGVGGLTVVQPARLQQWQYRPPLVICEIRVKGKVVPANRFNRFNSLDRAKSGGEATRESSGPSAPPLVLGPEENQLAVEFAALDFSAPELNRYSYRLANAKARWIDPDWIETDASRRLASYANLAPGSYDLHLRGANRHGQWNGQDLVLRFDILPAWHQTWWWYGFLLCAAGTGIAALVQVRTRALRQQRRKLENKVLHRTRQLNEKQTQLLETNQALQQTNEELAHIADTLRQTQAQLVQQGKLAALGTLVAGVAHELNTPLGVSLSALDGASQAWQRLETAISQGRLTRSSIEQITSEGKEFTELAQHNNQRAARLMDNFKAITVDLNHDEAHVLELVPYLNDIGTMYAHEFQQLGHQFRLDIDAPLPNVTLVHEALTEALYRILGNARDHAFLPAEQGQGQGQVRLFAYVNDQGRVAICIHDNGQGIAADAISKVFDPFFSTKTGSGQHIGLGLHIAYNQVVHRLKGELHIDSTPGSGTNVTILLPASRVDIGQISGR